MVMNRIFNRFKCGPITKSCVMIVICCAFSAWQINDFIERKLLDSITLIDKEPNHFEVLGIDNSMPTTLQVKKRYKEL